MKKLCVLGLGYIGLPTAAMFAAHGFEVVGVDVDDRVVDLLSNGEVHVKEPGLKTLVEAAVKSGKLRVAREAETADVFIIAVPTPLNRGPESASAPGSGGPAGETALPRADLSFVRSAVESVVPHLRAGNLVVLESTVSPRTVVDLLIPILRRSGLPVAGADSRRHSGKQGAAGSSDSDAAGCAPVLVAHCPERVLPGRILEELVHNDRVIGGADRASAEAARELYSTFVGGELFVTDATTAEMVKLMENSYRDVNIALANELSLVAERVGIDIWEAIELANRHPRVNILRPGPGVGGHCIAVDPWFIAEAAPQVTPLIQTARRVNDGMPGHVVELVKRAVGESWQKNEYVGSDEGPTRIACLGLAYKANVDDARESPALRVVQLLQAEGFEVRAYDPYVPTGTIQGQVESLEDAMELAAVAVILTDHDSLRKQVQTYLASSSRRRRLVDTRNWIERRLGQPGNVDAVVLGLGLGTPQSIQAEVRS